MAISNERKLEIGITAILFISVFCYSYFIKRNSAIEDAESLQNFTSGVWVCKQCVASDETLSCRQYIGKTLSIYANNKFSSTLKIMGSGKWYVTANMMELSADNSCHFQMVLKDYFNLECTWQVGDVEYKASFIRKTRKQTVVEQILGRWTVSGSEEENCDTILLIPREHRYYSSISTFGSGTWRLIYTNVIELKSHEGLKGTWTIHLPNRNRMIWNGISEGKRYQFEFYKK